MEIRTYLTIKIPMIKTIEGSGENPGFTYDGEQCDWIDDKMTLHEFLDECLKRDMVFINTGDEEYSPTQISLC